MSIDADSKCDNRLSIAVGYKTERKDKFDSFVWNVTKFGRIYKNFLEMGRILHNSVI